MQQLLLATLVASACVIQSASGSPTAKEIANSPELQLYQQLRSNGDDIPEWLNEAMYPASTDVPGVRQGGDTFETAVAIEFPFSGSGSTQGYNNDYDVSCPFFGSTAPDVVYAFTAEVTALLDVDLAGSQYDTKLYIYNAAMELVACNDDYYPNYVSALFDVEVVAGTTYYIVVDGFGSHSGVYTIHAVLQDECTPPILDPAFSENEAHYTDFDITNGGCNEANYRFQEFPFEGERCGTIFTYTAPNGGAERDSDWFLVNLPMAGSISFDIDCCGEWTALLMAANCELPLLYGQASTYGHDTLNTPFLPAGDYYFAIAPAEYTGMSSERIWHAAMSFSSPCDEATMLICGDNLSGDTYDAPNCFGNLAGDALFTFTPTRAGLYTFSTDNPGTGFDTYLWLYAGHPSLNDLVTENDDYDFTNLTSRITANLSAGVEYWLVLDGYFLEEGAFELSIECPESAYAELEEGQFALAQNYPNPFNPSTTIEFSLAETGSTQLAVYNITGQRVALLVNGLMESGTHSLRLDASTLPGGVYLYTLRNEHTSITRKMLLIK